MKKRIKINFTDFWFGRDEDELQNNFLFRLLDDNYALEITDNPDFVIYSSFGREFLKYRCVRVFYTGENTRPDFNDCDFAFSFDFPINRRNYRLPLYRTYDEFIRLKNTSRDVDTIAESKIRFCNFLYSNKNAPERIEFFKKLQSYKNVDSGGKVLNNLGYLVEDKSSFLRNYKFTIAFENSSYPGYTTEKILHALESGSIPIYWGNPDIHKDFNPSAFINCHDFECFEDVIKRIIEVDNDDSLYREYLRQPVFPSGENLEYLNEENILERFEYIFTKKGYESVSRRSDNMRYYLIKYRKKLRKIRRRIIRKFKNSGP